MRQYEKNHIDLDLAHLQVVRVDAGLHRREIWIPLHIRFLD